MTTPTSDPKREPGYRGSLPPRQDRLAKPWLVIVTGIFALIILLSIAGIPSRFVPDPTPIPTPVATPTPSVDPSASADPGSSTVPSASSGAAVPSESVADSPSTEPSPSG